MKKLKFSIMVIVSTLTLASCGGVSTETDAAAFGDIEKELKSKFGEKAFYSELTITHIESIGNVVNVTATEDPESLKMGEWNLTSGNWKQTSDVTIEVPEGTKAADFMFQLGDKINLTQLGELVEKSIEKLNSEKKDVDPVLSVAFIKFPDNGDNAKAQYTVILKPKTGGTTFTFSYEIDGTFIEMDY